MDRITPSAPNPPSTPKQKTSASVAHITPNSQGASGHRDDEVPQTAKYIDPFVTEDLKNLRSVSFEDFLEYIFLLPKSAIDELLEEVDQDFNDAFDEAFKEYQTAFQERGTHERSLYVPLAKLMNTAAILVDSDKMKVFYVQDRSMIVGADVEKSPDLCAVWAQTLKLETYSDMIRHLNENSWRLGSGNQGLRVFWGVLVLFLEIKHKNGNFIGLRARGDFS